jgi:tellurite resistance protein
VSRINLSKLDVENHQLREVHGDLARYGAQPPTPETKAQAAKAILAFAGADGRVSSAERTAWLACLRGFSVPPENVAQLEGFDPAGARIETLLTGEVRKLAPIVLYEGVRVARVDGFHAKEREAVQRAAKSVGIDPSVVPAVEALLDLEDVVKTNRHALLHPPKQHTPLPEEPVANEGAENRVREFGIAGPMPLHIGLRVGKAILTVAAADGELSEAEWGWFLGLAHTMGAPEQALNEFAGFDAVHGRIEELLDARVRPFAGVVLFDAIRTARVDGFAEKERTMARRGAQQLGLEPLLVDAIELQLRTEDALREARAKVLLAARTPPR